MRELVTISSPSCTCEPFGSDDQVRGCAQRVPALMSRRRAGVVGPAAEVALETHPAGQRTHDPERRSGVRDPVVWSMCNSMKPRSRGAIRRRSKPARVEAVGSHRVGKRDALIVLSRERRRHIEHARERLAPERRRVESGALLIRERDHSDRQLAALRHLKAAGHAERSIEQSTSANAVEVRPDAPPGPGGVRACPEVAGGVSFDCQSRAASLALEPIPHLAVGVCPGEAVCSVSIPADRPRVRPASPQGSRREPPLAARTHVDDPATRDHD